MPDSNYDFTEPAAGTPTTPPGSTEGGLAERATETWEETKHRADELFVHTKEYFRENPGAALLAAVGLGFLLGLAIRSAEEPEEKHPIASHMPDPDALKALFIPFFWPIVKFFTRSYATSSEYARDAYEKGRDAYDDINVKKYVKPIVKKVKRAF